MTRLLLPPALGRGTIPSLDGIRSLSIAIVFAGHVGISDRIPGGFGVTIFFFLSGFLITSLFIRERIKTGSTDVRGFYLRRILRLSPPLFFLLFSFYGLVWIGVLDGRLDPLAMASQLFYFHNYYLIYAADPTSVVAGLTPLWSLSVEEHFYMIFPVLFLLTATGRFGPGHYLLLLGAILCWRAVRVFALGDVEWTTYLLTDSRFDSILFGCFLAVLHWRTKDRSLLPEGLPAVALILCGALLTILATFLIRDDVFRSTLRYTVQGLALMPVFHYAVVRPDLLIFRPLNWTVFRWIGLYSYSIYLVHYVVIEGLTKHGVFANSYPAFVFACAALSVGVAAFVYHVIEYPARQLRHRLHQKAVVA